MKFTINYIKYSIWRPIFDENDKEQIIVNYNLALKILKITNSYSSGSDLLLGIK